MLFFLGDKPQDNDETADSRDQEAQVDQKNEHFRKSNSKHDSLSFFVGDQEIEVMRAMGQLQCYQLIVG